MRKVLLGSVLFLGGAGSAVAGAPIPATGNLTFVPLAPCRLVDTRPEAGNALLLSGTTVPFQAIGNSNFAAQGGSTSGCGVPADAKAIAVNIVMTNTSSSGHVRMWADGQPMPFAGVGTFNKFGSEMVYNDSAAIIPVNNTNGKFDVYAGDASFDLVVDVSGYFHPSPNGMGQGLNWGTISRNTIGSATAQLRNDGSAPGGTGALQLTVGTGPDGVKGDKIAFGNEVDFVDHPVFGQGGLNALSYMVKNSDENSSGHLPPYANLPALYIEINPMDGHTYATLNYSPTEYRSANSAGWSQVDAYADTSRSWGLTGSYYNDPTYVNARCGINGTRCTLAEIHAVVPDAKIISVAIGKGRDFPWIGEVDKLQINDTIYDFEAQGVVSVPAAP